MYIERRAGRRVGTVHPRLGHNLIRYRRLGREGECNIGQVPNTQGRKAVSVQRGSGLSRRKGSKKLLVPARVPVPALSSKFYDKLIIYNLYD